MLFALGACADDAPRAAGSDIAAEATTPPASGPAREPTDAPATAEDRSSTPPDTSQQPSTAPAPPGLGRRAPALRHQLLTAGQLPPVSPDTDWRGTGVSAAEQEGLARCQPFSLTAIGAEHVRTRTFVDDRRSKTPARAAHQVARFPDRRTTTRASSVLEAWHARCERRLARGAHRVRVRDRVSVEGLPGPASWYRTKVKARRGAVPVIEVTGTVRVGAQIGVVVLRHHKGAYTPAADRKHIVEALHRAAAALS